MPSEKHTTPSITLATPNTEDINNINVGGRRNKPPWGSLNRSKVIDIAGIVLPILAFAVASRVYSNELLLTYMMVYVVMAQGVNISYGFTGYLPFGYFGFFGAGAYAGSIAILNLHLPALVGVFMGGVGGMVFGSLLLPLFRLRGAYFAIGTLAAGLALADVISNPSLVALTNGPYGINLASVYSPGPIYVSAEVVMGIALVVVYILRHSLFGLSLRAIKDDENSAEMAGVNVVKMRSIAWLLASGLAGMAGAVFGWATTLFYPSAVFDANISVLAIVFAIFGGTESLWGPTLGTILLYSVYAAIGISNPQYFQLIYGLVVILLILFAPKGLVGLVNRKRRPTTIGESHVNS